MCIHVYFLYLCRYYHQMDKFHNVLRLLSNEVVHRAIALVGEDILREPLEVLALCGLLLHFCFHTKIVRSYWVICLSLYMLTIVSADLSMRYDLLMAILVSWSSVAQLSKALIFISRLLASHREGRRFEPCSLRKLYVRKFSVTCGRMVVLLSLNYSKVFLHQ